MPSYSRHASRFVTLLLLVVPYTSLAQQRHPQISEDEIKKHFSKAPDCEGVDIDNLAYFDFVGDGNTEAVVVASTCATGTAGPDVHAVLGRQPDGSLTELKIPDASEQQQARLFGRTFYDLSVEKGLLVETYHDQSGREDPLLIRFRWNSQHKEFQTVEVKTAPRYKASFDCDQAKTVVENAICSSSTAAALDLRLNDRYKSWLDHLNNVDSDILMKEQREWLRKRDVICSDDTEIFNCLEVLYQARMLELEQFKHLHP
jgi:uncharacterized protein YecT (DUF1311 family)